MNTRITVGFILGWAIAPAWAAWVVVDYPGATDTQIHGASGTHLVGHYRSGGQYGFDYDGSTWTALEYPGAITTYATGIEGGNVVGYYMDPGFTTRGFIYDGTTWTALNRPGSVNTYAMGISGGIVAGYFTDPIFTAHAFLYDGTDWTTLDYPGAQHTYVMGISGTMLVGYYESGGDTRGFLYDGSTWTSLEYPGAGRTYAMSEDNGIVVGYYLEPGDYRPHGFIFDGTNWATLDYPSASQTIARVVSGGIIAGYFLDAGYLWHGFTTEVCDPEACSPPTIVSAQSIKTHGGAGDFGIGLGVSPASWGIEPRRDGPTRIDVIFDGDIVAEDGTLAAGAGEEVEVTSNPPGAITISDVSIIGGNTLRISLSGVPARACMSVILRGIARDTGGGVPGAVMADATLRQRVITGDVTGNGMVSSADVNKTSAGLGSVTNDNFRCDVDADGTVTSTDINYIKGSTDGTIQTCP